MRLSKLIPAVLAYGLLQVALRRDDDADFVRQSAEKRTSRKPWRICINVLGGRLAYSVILRVVAGTMESPKI